MPAPKSLSNMLALTILLVSCNSAFAQNYRILLSNDDGIASPLLHALHDALADLPNTEVVVAAPNENKSGSSHSSDGGTLIVEPYLRDGEFFGYSVHGRPADAVRFGLLELGDETAFDLVVSGINRGANVGDVSHLSGTVGAAMEGVYQGVPAIAVSQDTAGVDTAKSAQFAASLVQRYQSEGAPNGVVLSINIPGGQWQGIAVRPMGDSYLQFRDYALTESTNERSSYEVERVIVQSESSSSDTYAYQQGYITITPLKFDWTAHEMISEIESWNLQAPNQ